MESSRSRTPSWVSTHPVSQIALFYLTLAGVVAVLYQIDPNLSGVFSMDRFTKTVDIGKGALGGASGGGPVDISPGQAALESLGAMFGAVLLMVPVAWVYILTRAKKGFSQSTVQTLIFLPIVVAGLIMLVQYSVALAFSLGGVVGAVSFRNRLEDPKDAIYIFLAIAVGLASGVQVMAVALSISAFYNLVVLFAWKFDFGRMPAALEAGVVSKRLERAKARTEQPEDFLKVVDQQLLKSMTPDQLQALSERAAHRSRKAAQAQGLADGVETEEEKKKFDSRLRVIMQPDDATAVRAAIEQVLAGQTKRWEFEKVGAGEGGRASVEYLVKFKRSIPSTLVVEAMRRSVIPKVVSIDVRDA